MPHTRKNKAKRKQPASGASGADPSIFAMIDATVLHSTMQFALPSSSAAKLGVNKDHTKPKTAKLPRVDSKSTVAAAADSRAAKDDNASGQHNGQAHGSTRFAPGPGSSGDQSMQVENKKKDKPRKVFRGKTRPNRQAMLDARARAQSSADAPGTAAPSESVAPSSDVVAPDAAADTLPPNVDAVGGNAEVDAEGEANSVAMDVEMDEVGEKRPGTTDLIQAASDLVKADNDEAEKKKKSERKWMSDWKYRKIKIKESVAARAARPHRGYTYIGGFKPVPSHIVPHLNHDVLDEILRILIRLNPRGKTRTAKKPQTAARVAIAFKTLYPTPHRIELVLARMEPTYVLRRAIKAHMTADPKDKEPDPEKKRKLNFMPLFEILKKHSNPNHLDTTKHHPLNMASMLGKVDILQWWFTSYPNRRSTYKGTKAADVASEKGYLHVLEWWRRSGLRVRASNKAVDLASKNGHLDVLRWWYKHYKTRFTSSSLAVDLASRMGHMHVLNFWFNQTQGFYYLRYSAKATTWAALQNKIHVLEWWRKIGAGGVTNRPIKYSVRAMDVASVHNNVGVLEWFKDCGLPIRFTPRIVLASKAAHWWRNSGLILPAFANAAGANAVGANALGANTAARAMTAEDKVCLIPAVCMVDPTTLSAEEFNRTEPREHAARLMFRFKRDASTRVFVETQPGVYVELKHPKYEKREKARRSGLYSSDVYTPYQMYQQMLKQDLVTKAEEELLEEYRYTLRILKRYGTPIVTGPSAAAAAAAAAANAPPTDADDDIENIEEFFNGDLKLGNVYAMTWPETENDAYSILPTIVRGVRHPKEVANIRHTFAMGFVTTSTDGTEADVEVDISMQYIRYTEKYRKDPVLKALLFEDIRRQIATKNTQLFQTLTADFEFDVPKLAWTQWLAAFLIGPGAKAKTVGMDADAASGLLDGPAPVTQNSVGPLALLLLDYHQDADEHSDAEEEHASDEDDDDYTDEDDEDMDPHQGTDVLSAYYGYAASAAAPGYPPPSLYPPIAPSPGISLFSPHRSHATASSVFAPQPAAPVISMSELMSYPTASASDVDVSSQRHHYQHHHLPASNPSVPFASDPSFSLAAQDHLEVQAAPAAQAPPQDELAMLLLEFGQQGTPDTPSQPQGPPVQVHEQYHQPEPEPEPDEYYSYQQPQLDQYQQHPDQYQSQYHQPDQYQPYQQQPQLDAYAHEQQPQLGSYAHEQQPQPGAYAYQQQQEVDWYDDQDVEMDDADDADESGLRDPNQDQYSHTNDTGGAANANYHNVYYGYATADGHGDSVNWEDASDDEDEEMSDEEGEGVDNEHLQEGY